MLQRFKPTFASSLSLTSDEIDAACEDALLNDALSYAAVKSYLVNASSAQALTATGESLTKTASSRFQRDITESLEWLSILLSHEIDARREHAVQCRIHRAEFPEITSLESFDWEFNPDINRRSIEELASLRSVDNNQIALF
jgi:DNA replication protein DnaC